MIIMVDLLLKRMFYHFITYSIVEFITYLIVDLIFKDLKRKILVLFHVIL